MGGKSLGLQERPGADEQEAGDQGQLSETPGRMWPRSQEQGEAITGVRPRSDMVTLASQDVETEEKRGQDGPSLPAAAPLWGHLPRVGRSCLPAAAGWLCW